MYFVKPATGNCHVQNGKYMFMQLDSLLRNGS